ncbi:MAG: ribonuclease H-like domain-containing protein [Anaerolineales bacterium]|nr:ribonuclease H-like domain-containing protein [Anaerolineales bacterium]
MKDLSSLRARLRQAGLKPASDLAPPVRRTRAVPVDWPGREVDTPAGSYFLAEYRYAADLRHGRRPLSEFLESFSFPGVPDFPQQTLPADMIFMDTETTGLAGGAGTMAFLVGTGYYDAGGFVVRQYFLADPSGEAAMLEDSLAEMESRKALVTFNGRVFDVPILQSRAAQRLRRFDALTRIFQFDLLTHARRLWGRRMESCALRALETDLLDVRRSSEDVPGGLIPYLYREYLQTNDPSLMAGVLYHNVQDVLSMAVLAAEVVERYRKPPAEFEDPLDALAMALVYRGLGRPALAEEGFRTALKARLAGADRARALEGLAGLSKAAGDYERAAEYWERWHGAAADDPRPCVELAKFHEWRRRDLEAAARWAKSALTAAAVLPDPRRRREIEHAVEHRMSRLEKKSKTAKRPPKQRR